MMVKRRSARRDPLEAVIQDALWSEDCIDYRAGWSLVPDLEDTAKQIGKLVRTDPMRAARLYEAFLAGCYDKAEDFDDSDGDLAVFVGHLHVDWLRARQVAGADPDETAELLLDQVENDPYGFADDVDEQAMQVMDAAGLAAFERAAKARLKAAARRRNKSRGADNLWAGFLRTIYTHRRDVDAYVALCEQTALSDEDCSTLATMLKGQGKPSEALAWVERGLALGKQRPFPSANRQLVDMRRGLLVQLGRGNDAIEEAWAEFREYPDKFRYEELMRFVPKAKRTAWHEKAMKAAERADLDSAIDLLLESKETARLVQRLEAASDAALEEISHYVTEPAAKHLAKTHPGVAARVFRALGMRILKARKSNYYDAALSNLEATKRCYERAHLQPQWNLVVEEVRREHLRKRSFMSGFERIAAGHGRTKEPSPLDRARRRWTARHQS